MKRRHEAGKYDILASPYKMRSLNKQVSAKTINVFRKKKNYPGRENGQPSAAKLSAKKRSMSPINKTADENHFNELFKKESLDSLQSRSQNPLSFLKSHPDNRSRREMKKKRYNTPVYSPNPKNASKRASQYNKLPSKEKLEERHTKALRSNQKANRQSKRTIRSSDSKKRQSSGHFVLVKETSEESIRVTVTDSCKGSSSNQTLHGLDSLLEGGPRYIKAASFLEGRDSTQSFKTTVSSSLNRAKLCSPVHDFGVIEELPDRASNTADNLKAVIRGSRVEDYSEGVEYFLKKYARRQSSSKDTKNSNSGRKRPLLTIETPSEMNATTQRTANLNFADQDSSSVDKMSQFLNETKSSRNHRMYSSTNIEEFKTYMVMTPKENKNTKEKLMNLRKKIFSSHNILDISTTKKGPGVAVTPPLAPFQGTPTKLSRKATQIKPKKKRGVVMNSLDSGWKASHRGSGCKINRLIESLVTPKSAIRHKQSSSEALVYQKGQGSAKRGFNYRGIKSSSKESLVKDSSVFSRMELEAGMDMLKLNQFKARRIADLISRSKSMRKKQNPGNLTNSLDLSSQGFRELLSADRLAQELSQRRNKELNGVDVDGPILSKKMLKLKSKADLDTFDEQVIDTFHTICQENNKLTDMLEEQKIFCKKLLTSYNKLQEQISEESLAKQEALMLRNEKEFLKKENQILESDNAVLRLKQKGTESALNKCKVESDAFKVMIEEKDELIEKLQMKLEELSRARLGGFSPSESGGVTNQETPVGVRGGGSSDSSTESESEKTTSKNASEMGETGSEELTLRKSDMEMLRFENNVLKSFIKTQKEEFEAREQEYNSEIVKQMKI